LDKYSREKKEDFREIGKENFAIFNVKLHEE
jgi:hypothetical protein